MERNGQTFHEAAQNYRYQLIPLTLSERRRNHNHSFENIRPLNQNQTGVYAPVWQLALAVNGGDDDPLADRPNFGTAGCSRRASGVGYRR